MRKPIWLFNVNKCKINYWRIVTLSSWVEKKNLQTEKNYFLTWCGKARSFYFYRDILKLRPVCKEGLLLHMVMYNNLTASCYGDYKMAKKYIWVIASSRKKALIVSITNWTTTAHSAPRNANEVLSKTGKQVYHFRWKFRSALSVPRSSVHVAKIERSAKILKKHTKPSEATNRCVFSLCFCFIDYYVGQSCKPIISPFEIKEVPTINWSANRVQIRVLFTVFFFGSLQSKDTESYLQPVSIETNLSYTMLTLFTLHKLI